MILTPRPPLQNTPVSRALDQRLSSTTPDVARQPERLSWLNTLTVSTSIGATLGVATLRGKGAPWTLRSMSFGALKGAATSFGIGASIIALDHLTSGEVKRQLSYISLDRRSQMWFVIKNARYPWIGPMGLKVASDARAAQERLYGRSEPLDGPQDAFRHAYAAALFTLRAMRDHNLSQANAAKLALEIGEAHERDGQDNNDELSRNMDYFNNASGAKIVADGRARDYEQKDERGFLTEEALAARVLDAMRQGNLQLVERTKTPANHRYSNESDLPT